MQIFLLNGKIYGSEKLSLAKIYVATSLLDYGIFATYFLNIGESN